MAEAPIPFKSLARRVKARDALKPPPDVALTKTMFLAGDDPKVELRDIEAVRPFFADNGDRMFKVEVDLGHLALGRHSFPPGVEGTELKRRRKLLEEDDHREALVGFLPDHLALRVRPEKLDKRLAVATKIDALAEEDPETRWATTVFTPENRYLFNDTAFPWCTAGRVETSAGGWASGVMIGPRHLLTCSHAIQWINPPNPYVAGWIKFIPSYFDGSEPFGAAWGIHIYWQQQVIGPDHRRHRGAQRLRRRRAGPPHGGFHRLDGLPHLRRLLGRRHVLEPHRVSGRPELGHPAVVRGQHQPQRRRHPARDQPGDLSPRRRWPGQSGGPFLGWWAGEGWPRVVADQSWQNASTNGASGGSHMVDLIIRARNDFP